MAKPYRLREAQIAAKVETTPGTAETLAAADLFIAQNIKLTPRFADTANEGLTGVLSREPGVSGIRTADLSFDVLLKGQGAAGTAPEWRDAIMACGCSETISGGVSVTYKPAAPESYYTFGFNAPGLGGAGEDLLFRIAGAQGNMKLSWKAGMPMMASFTMQGVWVAPADGTVLSPSGWDATAPYAFLNPAMLFHTVSLAFETFEMDMGNLIEIRPNANSASGALTAQITGRRVTGSVDIEAEKLATFDIWSRVGSNTTGAISMTPIGAAGNLIDLDLPKVRFMEPDLGERAGALTTPVKFEALRSATTGNDEFSLILT
jgi:hypothetical protein